jgi:hypothetical protein
MPAALSAPRRQRRHDGDGVVVRRDDNPLVFEGGVAARQDADDVVALAHLPRHAAGEFRLQVGLSLGEGDEFCGVLARQPEAGHIERDADELRFCLAASGRLRLNKHNRTRAQPRGV